MRVARIAGSGGWVWQAVAVSVALHCGLACMPGSEPLQHGGARDVATPFAVRLRTSVTTSSLSPPALDKAKGQQEVSGSSVPSVVAERSTEPRSARASSILSMNERESLASAASQVGEEAAIDPYADYLSAQKLDIIPTPVSAPDSQQLNGMVLKELQVDVKLYVDASGKVRQVIVDVPEDEEGAAQPLRSMFENTAFVPGRKDGKAVSSVLAIQIGIRDLSPIRHIASNH